MDNFRNNSTNVNGGYYQNTNPINNNQNPNNKNRNRKNRNKNNNNNNNNINNIPVTNLPLSPSKNNINSFDYGNSNSLDHQPYSNTINTINRNNYNNNFNKFNNYNNGIPNNIQNNQNQNQNRNNKFNKYQNKRRNGSQGTYGYSHNDNYDLINDRLNKSLTPNSSFGENSKMQTSISLDNFDILGALNNQKRSPIMPNSYSFMSSNIVITGQPTSPYKSLFNNQTSTIIEQANLEDDALESNTNTNLESLKSNVDVQASISKTEILDNSQNLCPDDTASTSCYSTPLNHGSDTSRLVDPDQSPKKHKDFNEENFSDVTSSPIKYEDSVETNEHTVTAKPTDETVSEETSSSSSSPDSKNSESQVLVTASEGESSFGVDYNDTNNVEVTITNLVIETSFANDLEQVVENFALNMQTIKESEQSETSSTSVELDSNKSVDGSSDSTCSNDLEKMNEEFKDMKNSSSSEQEEPSTSTCSSVSSIETEEPTSRQDDEETKQEETVLAVEEAKETALAVEEAKETVLEVEEAKETQQEVIISEIDLAIDEPKLGEDFVLISKEIKPEEGNIFLNTEEAKPVEEQEKDIELVTHETPVVEHLEEIEQSEPVEGQEKLIELVTHETPVVEHVEEIEQSEPVEEQEKVIELVTHETPVVEQLGEIEQSEPVEEEKIVEEVNEKSFEEELNEHYKMQQVDLSEEESKDEEMSKEESDFVMCERVSCLNIVPVMEEKQAAIICAINESITFGNIKDEKFTEKLEELKKSEISALSESNTTIDLNKGSKNTVAQKDPVIDCFSCSIL